MDLANIGIIMHIQLTGNVLLCVSNFEYSLINWVLRLKCFLSLLDFLGNRDVPPGVNRNLYGSHPFYMAIEDSENAMGFFFLNSNAMDVNVQPKPALTFITIGGIIDFYVYLGPGPREIVAQHSEVIGKPFFPPYFTLGFHLCRWKYNNNTNLKDVT